MSDDHQELELHRVDPHRHTPIPRLLSHPPLAPIAHPPDDVFIPPALAPVADTPRVPTTLLVLTPRRPLGVYGLGVSGFDRFRVVSYGLRVTGYWLLVTGYGLLVSDLGWKVSRAPCSCGRFWFRVSGFGFRFRVHGSGLRVQGVGCRVQGLWFKD